MQSLLADLELALAAETFPAIREVLKSNLQTQREMDAEDDFELE